MCACREAVVVAPSVRTPVDQAVESEEEEPPMDPLECVLSLSARCLPAVCPLSANRRCSCLAVLLFEPDALISRWSEGGLR